METTQDDVIHLEEKTTEGITQAISRFCRDSSRKFQVKDSLQAENLQPHWANNWIVIHSIFKNLTNSELSVCAKVCRQWNHEVQKIRNHIGLKETIKITGRNAGR